MKAKRDLPQVYNSVDGNIRKPEDRFTKFLDHKRRPKCEFNIIVTYQCELYIFKHDFKQQKSVIQSKQ